MEPLGRDTTDRVAVSAIVVVRSVRVAAIDIDSVTIRRAVRSR